MRTRNCGKNQNTSVAKKFSRPGKGFQCGSSSHYVAQCPLACEEKLDKSEEPARKRKWIVSISTGHSSTRSKLKNIKVSCRDQVIDLIVDTGAEITVAREGSVRNDLVTPRGSI